MLLRGLDVISHLLYEVVGQQIFADSHQVVWQAGHKSRPSVGKYKHPLIFHPYNQL